MSLEVPAPAPVSSIVDTSPDKSRLAVLMGRISAAVELFLGGSTAAITLAIISVVPVLNLLSLGYLLEASGRVARSGRIRDGFIGFHRFATLGKVFLAAWLWTIPIRILHSFWIDAELIDSGSEMALRLRAVLVVTTIGIAAHLVWACLRGGKLRYFLWPAPILFLRWIHGSVSVDFEPSRFVSFLRELRLVHLFRLGTLGFLGAVLWLAIPVTIMVLAAGAKNAAPSALFSFFGGILLGFSALYLPFLQTRFALTNEFSEFFSNRAARKLFARAPIAFWFALFVTLLFALPLYLLKIELTPEEVAWLPNLIFVIFIFPARLLLGWALSRAELRDKPRFWISRWFARFAALPVVAAYVFIVWLTQYLSWHGPLSLLEQHAFLVPAPLFGL